MQRAGVVGLGSRATMWAQALARAGHLVAFADPNSRRLAVQTEWVREATGCGPVTGYPASDLQRMIEAERLDTLVVCSPDNTHAGHVVLALRSGCDVVVEKPLATTQDACRAIAQAQARSGRSVRVGFNYRYNPVHEKVRSLLAGGAIGTVGSVHFEWLLDLHHGADYFRRWHRDREVSGGLLVHKSSHHFDLVNWWIGAVPERVFADGRLFFYGPDGLGARQASAPEVLRAFELDLSTSPRLVRLYQEAEPLDGYRRDRSVFAPGVTIDDDVSVQVRYDTGATMSYHLTAYSPWEGYRVAFNGSAGRLELDVEESGWADPAGGGTDHFISGRGAPAVTRSRLSLRRHWQPPEEIDVSVAEGGGHGGGDERMLSDVLAPSAADDPLGRGASFVDGVRAAMIGICADQSIRTGQAVDVGAAIRGVLEARAQAN